MLKQIILGILTLLAILIAVVLVWIAWFNSQAKRSAELNDMPYGIFRQRTGLDGSRVQRSDFIDNFQATEGAVTAGIELATQPDTGKAQQLRLFLEGIGDQQNWDRLILRPLVHQEQTGELALDLSQAVQADESAVLFLLHEQGSQSGQWSLEQIDSLAAAEDVTLHLAAGAEELPVDCIGLGFILTAQRYRDQIQQDY